MVRCTRLGRRVVRPGGPLLHRGGGNDDRGGR